MYNKQTTFLTTRLAQRDIFKNLTFVQSSDKLYFNLYSTRGVEIGVSSKTDCFGKINSYRIIFIVRC